AEAPKEEQAARWTGLPPELRARAVVALVPCLVDEDGDHARALGQLAFGQPDRFVEEIIGAIEGDHWQLGDIKRGLALLLSPERATALDLPRGYGPSIAEQLERTTEEHGYPTRIGRVRRTADGLTLDGHAPGSLDSALEALARLSGEWRAPKRPCGEPLYQAIPEPRRVPLAT